MHSTEERPPLHDALESLHNASRTPAKQRAIKVFSSVDVICRHAFEDGLEEDALRAVVQLVCVKTHLDQTTVTTLVKNLYPTHRVPADVIVTIVGALGQGKGKPSPGTQDSLVKWLRSIHEIIEDPNGLLRVFKDYYPDIILGSTSISKKSFAPDASTAADETLIDRYNGFKVLRKGPKNSEASAIPDVHTYHATEASVTLEGIDNVEEFVERLDRIEPPGQMIAFLTDPLLQKIDLWLSTCLEDLYESKRSGNGDLRYAEGIFDSLLRHADTGAELHPTTLNFLQAYLPIWNGQEHYGAILGLLSHIPIGSFPDAYTDYFASVEQALSSHGPAAYEKLVNFYTSLLQKQLCAAISQPPGRSSATNKVFQDLAAHVSTLSNSLLLSLPAGEGQPLISSVLSFYELLSTSSKPHIVPIILPPMHLVYLLTQHTSSTTFSRICGVIGAHKAAFDVHPKPVKQYYPNDVTDSLNWCLRDIYHLIWIARALLTADNKALGLHCHPDLRTALNDYLISIDREYAIGAVFGLSNHAWLAAMSAAAWRTMEEREIAREGYDKNSVRYHQGPVSGRSLEVLKRKGGVSVDWDGAAGYKVFVLNWLAERGLNGIRDLMFATVTELRDKA
ncbi:hypothetical protein SNOG_01553 [Parastagonospora nodorum SN15]|uniref:Mis6 domain-containing protein n=1 Tax=Phaeosphaeria nodorum (strain SN15 / ATCC MYA-4574 / FGSC 10173) TaxID=321614 RepID=Q0V361_PHANO|nr:hypothetical protein SNOG_01553 [Parastagonospora nodorum SN15]EAT91202.2 hypothetical protein SNOG_01553 [Parastagonospora nodorum SN15]